eukprot:4736965-Amphidinium_carterae.1
MTGKPRWHDLHNLEVGACRWAVAPVRRAAEQHTRGRHDLPRAALPRAHEEPTARIAGSHRLGELDEEEATRLEEDEEMSREMAENIDHPEAEPADARAGRGPDRQPRHLQPVHAEQ